jgi:N-acetylglutamate synthase-like GNAT family acetyltransferase
MNELAELQIVDYLPKYALAFKTLNEAWIEKYFEIEEEDKKTLRDPGKIIENGGYVFIALLEGKAIGVCALKKSDSDTFEFSKMAVAENIQGHGIGRKLGEAAIEKAKSVGAKRIYLEGNTFLEASIHLYKKLGFKEIHWKSSSYKRVNIAMEMLF